MSEKLKILIVEDSENDFLLIKRELKVAGFNFELVWVETEAGYREALEAGDIDLILSDYTLPQFSGLRALEIYKELKIDIPFIVVSGNIGEDAAIETMHLGASDYIMKDKRGRLAPAIKRELNEFALIRKEKQAEADLIESEERFRLISENASMIIVELNENAEIEYVNKAFTKITEYSINEIIGKKPFGIFYKADESAARNKFDEMKHGAPSAPFPARLVSKMGKRIWVNMIGNKYLSSKGEERYVVICDDITERVDSEIKIKESREELRRLAKNMINIREEERAEISRIVHDDLGQILTALKMDMKFLLKKHDELSKEVKDKINSMLEINDKAIESTKNLSSDMRPALLDDLGLTSAIEWMLKEHEKRYNLKIKLTSQNDLPLLTKDLKNYLFRIVQEAMTNIVRHANAKNVWVVLNFQNNHISISVKDDGKGFFYNENEKIKSLGLLGIRERARILNGELKINTTINQGTEIFVSVPI